MSKLHNPNLVKYRMKPIIKVKIQDERFATRENRKLMARATFKRAVIKVLTKIQAYHLYEKIKRNKLCVIPVHYFVKDWVKQKDFQGVNNSQHSHYEDSDEHTIDDQDSDDDSVDISQEEKNFGSDTNSKYATISK